MKFSMETFITNSLKQYGLADDAWAYPLVVLMVILASALLLHLILHSVVLRALSHSAEDSRFVLRRAFYKNKLFDRLALTLQGVLVLFQAHVWLDKGTELLQWVSTGAILWILVCGLLTFFALLNSIEYILMPTRFGKMTPLRGILQGIKLVAALVVLILSVSILSGRSPFLLLSGLGAMTAVLLLVFKDPILGFVAGIQLSANKMLALGDWVEAPKLGADGAVIDITLTTVKVRNWDNTITNIPAYALIADSFKNWRGMSESGGRRIKRAIYIDATSVQFLDDDDIARLRRASLLNSYIEERLTEIGEENARLNVDLSSPVNGRRLTNLGTFRAYLVAYLKQHPNIHTGMTAMVRQLAPEPTGIPLEIYAFCNDTAWVKYEQVQSDIFDHIFAIIDEFELRVYQQPSGHDLLQLATVLHAKPEKP